MAAESAPEVSLFSRNLSYADRALGDQDAARAHADDAERARATYGTRTMALHFR
jgi:hypothetical protein